jgi:hypothetical protein
MHPSSHYEAKACLVNILYAVSQSVMTFHRFIVSISLDYGAVYPEHLAGRTVLDPICLCQSTLGDRASEQLHRHNQNSIPDR